MCRAIEVRKGRYFDVLRASTAFVDLGEAQHATVRAEVVARKRDAAVLVSGQEPGGFLVEELDLGDGVVVAEGGVEGGGMVAFLLAGEGELGRCWRAVRECSVTDVVDDAHVVESISSLVCHEIIREGGFAVFLLNRGDVEEKLISLVSGFWRSSTLLVFPLQCCPLSRVVMTIIHCHDGFDRLPGAQ
jgi:hypothetical protein